MPIYEFQHPTTGQIFEVLRPFSKSGQSFVAPDGVKCEKLISSPQIKIGEAKPDRYERKEKDQTKRVKDPERARKQRKAKFGTEGISITKSPFYHKEKRVKAQGASDVNKKDFVQAAARNPHAMKAAIDIVNKKGSVK